MMTTLWTNAVGGLIANEAHGIVTLVLSRIREEIRHARKYKEEFEKLHEQFDDLNKLLHGPAENSLVSNNNVLLSDWLRMVKKAAYDADDLLDEYSYETLKRENRSRNRDKFKDKFTSYPVRRILIHRVKGLSTEISKIYSNGEKLGITPMKVVAGRSSRLSHDKQQRKLQEQRQWVDYNSLAGRNKDLDRLIKLLCDRSNNTKDLTVVGIVGLAGLGKTTLSKQVAKVPEVKKYYSWIFWLVVSHTFDVGVILKKMAEQLFKNASNMSNSDEALVKGLHQKLKGKRYLLILDDVWDTFLWETLKFALQEIGGSKGTTVLMTSRDKKVLANINTYGDDIQKDTYELEGLDNDDSWSLFKRTVGSGNLTDGEFQELGRSMIKKCGGVPLAITALGDLLRNKSVEKWREVEKNHVWHEQDSILPSLKLSFNYLPNVALKKCFSYCAIFYKEDEVIQKDKLIQMWMAQGFLQPYDNMEGVGEESVDILLNSSLFQKPSCDQLGNVMTFKIHELVSSLAHASGEECLNLEMNSKFKDSLTTEARHLSTTLLPSKDHPHLTSSFCEKLRTYYYCYPQVKHLQDCESLKLFLKHSSCLRVLCLPRLNLDKLPTSIGDLKHLRYLDISQNCFDTLPDVIISLYHLQTLRIDYNTKGELGCSLPLRDVCKLVSLRHISAEYVDIGILEGMGRLTALQTLSTINLKSNWGGKASELGYLNNLRGTLGIGGLDAMSGEQEARGMHLGKKSNVDRLILKWSTYLDKRSTADCILKGLEPHDKLAALEVAHYNGTSFPAWLMVDRKGSQRLCNLVSLTLQHCLYAEGDLKLENLTGLRFLSLECCRKLTISFPECGFHCCKLLESLKLISCNKVGNLPNLSPLTELQYLEVIDCDSITTTSELVGLACLPCLREVNTDRLLPTELSKDSPLCRSLHSLNLSAPQQLAGTATLPHQLRHLSALQTLHIKKFQSMQNLPDWLWKLTSLSSLALCSLPNLKHLPSQDAMQRFSNLTSLCIWECPLLDKQIRKNTEEWSKIACIPSLVVDY
ncbi:hypothetical protein BVRB_5g113940 [Beta vulgaris subsp. vulgaris]|nr:hypothetical protein BVRB_5g113940 [Beta vulgaris subsp. vulgaris]